MDPDFCYETAKLGQILCSGVCDVTAEDVQRFRSLFGYSAVGDTTLAPSSMGLTYGLRLGWEHSIFPPGVVRMGDDDVFGVPARVGDRLTTTFSIVEKFEKKQRRFLRYKMQTINQAGELVCSIDFVGLMP